MRVTIYSTGTRYDFDDMPGADALVIQVPDGSEFHHYGQLGVLLLIPFAPDASSAHGARDVMRRVWAKERGFRIVDRIDVGERALCEEVARHRKAGSTFRGVAEATGLAKTTAHRLARKVGA